MMPKDKEMKQAPGCSWLQAQPAPQVCVACIEASSGAVSNTDRMMTGAGGETVGVKMQSARQVRQWMDSLDRNRCPCFP